MIIPELPAYLTSLGGAEYKGLIIALFTLTAGISRPFSGKLADTVGRKPIIFFGISVCVICSLFYPLLTTVSGFLLLRLLHGFSTGFSPTATSAYVADVVPVHRRGEAMGIIGVCMNVGASISPPFGSYLVGQVSINSMFFASSIAALYSLLILLGIKETLPQPQRFHPKLLALKPHEIIYAKAFRPAAVCALVHVGFGAILTIIPDQTVHLGMTNKGLFLIFITISSVLSRILAGKLSDRMGRVQVLRIALVFVVITLVLMGQVQSWQGLFFVSALLGFSMGLASPAIFAWAIDVAEENSRGKSLGTTYIGLEVGIGFGALLSAYLYDNSPDRFDLAFNAIAITTSLAFLFLLKRDRVVLSKN